MYEKIGLSISSKSSVISRPGDKLKVDLPPPVKVRGGLKMNLLVRASSTK